MSIDELGLILETVKCLAVYGTIIGVAMFSYKAIKLSITYTSDL